MNYVPASKITKEYEVSNSTLQKWANSGKVKCVRTPGGKRLYDLRSIESIFGEKESTRKNICYTRVSSIKQKEDLDRQKQLLHSKFPSHELISDIGSGLNYSRPGFKKILGSIMRGEVDELVVDYRDRFCRYGFEVIEQMCAAFNTKLVILFKSGGCDNELGEDLLAIVGDYVAKNDGKRTGSSRRQRPQGEIQRESPLAAQEAEADLANVGESCEMDL